MKTSRTSYEEESRKITREEFVQICNQCIFDTRRDIAIRNQIDGYLKYHKEIKKRYFKKVREERRIYMCSAKNYSLFYRHELIKHAGMGCCLELADYLAVEILKRLKACNANATVEIVKSEKYDHAFLRIRIALQNEKGLSIWEVEAWDPRIIDISIRPDGTMKNADILIYGTMPKLIFSVTANNFLIPDCFFLFGIHKPIEGQSENFTPREEIINKHYPLIYENHTLEDAVNDRKIDINGKIHYLQKRSHWQ